MTCSFSSLTATLSSFIFFLFKTQQWLFVCFFFHYYIFSLRFLIRVWQHFILFSNSIVACVLTTNVLFLQLIVGSRINLSSNCKCQLLTITALFSIISIWMRNFLIAFLYPSGLGLLRGRSWGGCRRGHPMVGRRSHLDVLLRRFLSGRAVVADYVISVSDLASVITGGRRFLRTLFHAFQRGRGRTRTCPTFPRKWAGPRFVFWGVQRRGRWDGGNRKLVLVFSRSNVGMGAACKNKRKWWNLGIYYFFFQRK